MSENEVIAKIVKREKIKTAVKWTILAIVLLVVAVYIFLPQILVNINIKEREGNNYTAEEIAVIEELFHIKISDTDEIIGLRATFIRDYGAQIWIKPGGEFQYDRKYELEECTHHYVNSDGERVEPTAQYVYPYEGVTPDEMCFYSKNGTKYVYCHIGVSGEKIDKVLKLFH